MKQEIDIPPFYLALTKGYTMRGKMFKSYVLGYLAVSFPELELIKIEGMKAICHKRFG